MIGANGVRFPLKVMLKLRWLKTMKWLGVL
jgi:hypothetical protein